MVKRLNRLFCDEDENPLSLTADEYVDVWNLWMPPHQKLHDLFCLRLGHQLLQLADTPAEGLDDDDLFCREIVEQEGLQEAYAALVWTDWWEIDPPQWWADQFI